MERVRTPVRPRYPPVDVCMNVRISQRTVGAEPAWRPRFFNTGQITDGHQEAGILRSRIVEAGGEIVNAQATGITTPPQAKPRVT